MPAAPGDDARRTERREAYVVAAVAVVVALMALWRCTLSVGLTDDAYYIAVPMRLGEGGRIFFNEMWLQSMGFWIVVPFIRAWKVLFGMGGIVLAVRAFYVVVAGFLALVVYRALRPSFGPAGCALAAVVPAIAAPYNILSINYNTTALLGFMVASALMFAAARDGSRVWAVGAGIAVGYTVMSYPPLFPAAVVLLATYSVVARGRKVALATWLVAAGIVGVGGVLLVAFSSVPDVVRTMAHMLRAVPGAVQPVAKLRHIARQTADSTVLDPYLAPLWVIALVASIPPLPARFRSVALILLPVAAALSGIMRFVNHQETHWFSSIAAGYLIIFVLAAMIPVTVMAIARRRVDVLRLLALAAPLGVVGFVLVTYSSGAGWWRGSPVIVLGPLALAVMLGWVDDIREGAGRTGVAIGALCLLVALFGFSFGTSHDDQPPFRLYTRVSTGPYAGITTTRQRAFQMRDFERAAARWVKPSDRVLVVGGPFGYLFLNNPMATNAVWMVPGKTDSELLDYYARTGDTPDVAFINKNILTPGSVTADPLVGYLTRGYHAVDTVGNVFVVWVRNR